MLFLSAFFIYFSYLCAKFFYKGIKFQQKYTDENTNNQWP
ncbi:hypothetical protein BACPLE_03599 [Phocaeicola plebeius DSM 17135]|uniref:Uncharacterized protein n=1 Tax=Phocaeicola plebeius (strain DSM 17135 / JCM 12973 / CCUG 54634 / M2) TaxID=484018 RepID=B5D3K6_PHOPM|nr:hypothetical protein BACPLE_03599 [Phocaeicola plebeius DSM 17135]